MSLKEQITEDMKAAMRAKDSGRLATIRLLTELRAREFYEKPTSERKRKLAAAVKRTHKRLRSQLLPPKLY